MQPSLARSFLIVAVFWSVVAWLTFGFADPQENLRVLYRLYAYLPGLDPATLPTKVSVLDGAWMQRQVLLYWTIPLLLLVGFMLLLGLGVTWGLAYREHRARLARAKGTGAWRQVTVTRGALPLPPALTLAHEVRISWTPVMRGCLERLSPEEHTLLAEILGYIAAHPDAYTGAGHGVSLLDHTLHVIDQVAADNPADPLILLAAAAHDMGKITTFKKNAAGEWYRAKMHDRESARLLALLPGYWDLQPTRRRALTMAVKYDHAPGKRPAINPEVDQLASELMAALQRADRQATATEKAEVVQAAAEERALPETVFDAFLQALPLMQFSTFNQQKEMKAVGWRKDKRLYFIEHQVFNLVLERLSPDLRAAWSKRKRGEVPALTQNLLRTCADNGWLVVRNGDIVLQPESALWTIKSGTKDFRGVWAIEPSQEVLDRAPQVSSAYKIQITGPYFQEDARGVETVVTPDALLDAGVFRSAESPSGAPARKSRRHSVSPQINRELPKLAADVPEAVPAPFAVVSEPDTVAVPAGASVTADPPVLATAAPVAEQPAPPADAPAWSFPPTAPAQVDVPDAPVLAAPAAPVQAEGAAPKPRPPKPAKPAKPATEPASLPDTHRSISLDALGGSPRPRPAKKPAAGADPLAGLGKGSNPLAALNGPSGRKRPPRNSP